MKKLLVFVLILLFSNSFSQEIDCEKLYQEAKEKFDKDFGDIENVDYSNLSSTIIEALDLSKFTEKNLAFYFTNERESCPSGVPKSPCEPFVGKRYYFNERELWKANNILALQNKIKKDIIPLTHSQYLENEKAFYSVFEIKNSKAGIAKLHRQIYDGSKDKTFYYFPHNKNKKLVLTKINSVCFSETDIIETFVHHINSKEVKIDIHFINNERKNYTQTYEYVDNKWKLAISNP